MPKGKGVDQGESPLLLREGMLTTDMEDLFAMIPRAESELSYATPCSTLEPILNVRATLRPTVFQA